MTTPEQQGPTPEVSSKYLCGLADRRFEEGAEAVQSRIAGVDEVLHELTLADYQPPQIHPPTQQDGRPYTQPSTVTLYRLTRSITPVGTFYSFGERSGE